MTLKRIYSTLPIISIIFAWKGTSNHTAEEIQEVKDLANEHELFAKPVGEQLHLMGFNGTHIANVGDFAVFQGGFYETVNRETLDLKYKSDDPYPGGEPAANMFPQENDPGPSGLDA